MREKRRPGTGAQATAPPMTPTPTQQETDGLMTSTSIASGVIMQVWAASMSDPNAGKRDLVLTARQDQPHPGE